MELSESYKNRLRILSGLKESKENSVPYFEYQMRDIGGPVFYKRKKGSKEWSFISAEEFAKEACNGKMVDWDA